MTVQADFNKVVYISDGVVSSYEFTFVTHDASWISVIEDNAETVLPFEVILNADQEANPGGFMNYTGAVPDDEVQIVILRTSPLSQEIDYTSFDPFPAESHERGLDQGIIIAQQQQEEIDRAYKAPVGSDPGEDFSFPPYDPGKLIGWSETVENQLDNAEESFADIEAEADRATAGAVTSEGWASVSATQAGLSEEWASNPEDDPVTGGGGLFSARHYAIKALRARSGLNLIAIISGDDLCPKPGDNPPEVCQVPDHRNPGQRFPERVNIPGDYFIISQAGNMDLRDPTDPEGPDVTTFVEPSDYIIFLPEVEVDGDIIVGEGWHRQAGLAGEGGSADTITFDDSGTIIKGTSVQAWNEAADAVIETNRASVAANGVNINLNGIAIGTNNGLIVDNAAAIGVNAGRLDGHDIDIANNAAAASGANVNANARKPEFDFIRTGTRLDINNVRTS